MQQVGLVQLRALQQVQPWSREVDLQLSLDLQLLRRCLVRVAVRQMHRRQRGRLQELQWRHRVDRHLRLVVLLAVRRGARERRWSRQQQLLVRLLVRQQCSTVVARRR